jgi:hypothetical protein
VTAFINAGVPPEKLDLGLANYGRTFRLTTDSDLPGQAPAAGEDKTNLRERPPVLRVRTPVLRSVILPDQSIISAKLSCTMSARVIVPDIYSATNVSPENCFCCASSQAYCSIKL